MYETRLARLGASQGPRAWLRRTCQPFELDCVSMPQKVFQKITFFLDEADRNNPDCTQAQIRTSGEHWGGDALISPLDVGEQPSELQARRALADLLRDLADIVEYPDGDKPVSPSS